MRRKTAGVLAAVCALFFLSSVLVAAQDRASGEAQNAISVNVLGASITAIADSTSGLVAVPLSVDYQRVLLDHYTLSIIPRIEFLVASGIPNSISYSTLDSFDLQPWVEVDWHPFDTGLSGFFVGGAAVGSLDVKWSGNQDTTIFLGVAPVVGYVLVLPGNINLDFALGVAFGGNIVIDSAENTSFGLAVDHSRIEIGLGYQF
jgi:hypothetical protein